MSTQVEYPSDTEMKFIRVLQAPRALVWQAWADISQVAKWWGPEGFTITTLERDFKAGGIWRLTMHGPDGTDYPNRIAYLEVSEPSRLVYDHGSDEEPQMFHVVTEFIDLGASTRIESTMKFPSKDARDATGKYAIEGHSSTMNRLEKLLANAG